MRFPDIRPYLKPYSIVRSRSTTINHAFAASVAPCDVYNDAHLRQAIRILGQDPDADLVCAYCGKEAETWDHIHATVRDKKFSGHGHRVGNLLPCCKPCNSKKGNKPWVVFLASLPMPESDRSCRMNQIESYLEKLCAPDPIPEHLPEYQQLQAIRSQVIELFQQADELAATIRRKCGAG